MATSNTLPVVEPDLDLEAMLNGGSVPAVPSPAVRLNQAPQAEQKPAGKATNKSSDLDEIKKGIAVLFRHGDVVEMRIPKAGKLRTISGYFDNSEALAKAIREWSGKPEIEGVYYTLNPVAPALLARAANRAKVYATVTTSDRDILRRRWLLVDVDPDRPSGVSSTNAEKQLAATKGRAVRDYLRELQWPEPLVADSGNGYHLLYAIELPNDEASGKLIQSCLEALAAKFNDASAKIDTAVFNPARIVKAYGSLAAKGDSTLDRPHRLAKLHPAMTPGGKEAVPLAKLEALAKLAPVDERPPGRSGTNSGAEIQPHKVTEFLEFYGIASKEQTPTSNGHKWVLEECLFNPEHQAPDAAVILWPGGGLGYECFHASCQQYHWKEFRNELEKRTSKKFWFFPRVETAEVHEVDTAPSIEDVEPESEPAKKIKPLSDVALYGLLGEFVERLLPETEADAPGLLFQGLAMTGNFLGPKPYFMVRETKHRANLYVCLVGTTSCGKGEGRDLVDALLQAARSDWHGVTGLNSGEGIAQIAKDDDHPDVIKTFCFDETEFARLLETCYRKGSTVGPALRMGWDKTTFEVVNKNSPIRAQAMISLVGHITPQELLTTLSDRDLSNGFANRILWVRAESSKDVPDTGTKFDWSHLAQRLRQSEHIASVIGELDFDAEARELWHSVYPQLKNRPDNVFGKVTARARPNVKRMAMIYALLPPTSHGVIGTTALELLQANKIGILPLQAALAAWHYAEDSAQVTFAGSSVARSEETLKVKIAVAKNNGKLTSSQLHSLFSRKTQDERIEVALRAGLKPYEQQTKGRPITMWKW